MFKLAKKNDGKWYIISAKGEYGKFDEIKDCGEIPTDKGPKREFIVKKEGKFWILRFEVTSGEKSAELGPYSEIK